MKMLQRKDEKTVPLENGQKRDTILSFKQALEALHLGICASCGLPKHLVCPKVIYPKHVLHLSGLDFIYIPTLYRQHPQGVLRALCCILQMHRSLELHRILTIL